MIGDKIKGLGEVIILVENIKTVKQFYEEVIGLEILAQDAHFVFFKIAEGYGGHPQVLGLFDNSNPTAFGQIREKPEIKSSSLHHLALEIDKSDYDVILNALIKKGIEVEDMGAHTLNLEDDYPDFIIPAAKKVARIIFLFIF